MTIITEKNSENKAVVCLCAVTALPLVLAQWPHVGSVSSMNWLSQLRYSQDIAAVTSILLVVLLSVKVYLLSARLKDMEATQRLESHAALHDALTNAANRRQFESRLEELLADGNPSHALLMIDLDRFKPINDLYGHAAGDALLCEIASGISRLTQHHDVVARLGGDEFAILLVDTPQLQAEQTANQVLQFVMKHRLLWGGERLGVGASIGMANIDQAGLSSSVLLAAADEALYAAKESGRGAIYVAEISAETDGPRHFRRVNSEPDQTICGKRSHEPEDSARQEVDALLMYSRLPENVKDRRRAHGARRRHEVRHWVSIEPKTLGDGFGPGMQMRELVSEAATRSDGGADFVRWLMAMAIDAASRLSPVAVDRIEFVIPAPASAFVAVPSLTDELLRCNALSLVPIRHITFVLHGVESVYNSPALKEMKQLLDASDFRLGYEIRVDSLEVLAPLRYVSFDEIHLGREIVKRLRPGSSGSGALDALFVVTQSMDTTLVATCVDTQDEIDLLTSKGVTRITTPLGATTGTLHDVLANLA